MALFVTGGGGTPSCHYNSILPPVSGFGDRKQGRVKINQRFVCSNGELIRYRANDGHPGLTSPNNRSVSAVPTHHYRPSSPKNDQTNGDWISPNYACLLLLWFPGIGQCMKPLNLCSENIICDVTLVLFFGGWSDERICWQISVDTSSKGFIKRV